MVNTHTRTYIYIYMLSCAMVKRWHMWHGHVSHGTRGPWLIYVISIYIYIYLMDWQLLPQHQHLASCQCLIWPGFVSWSCLASPCEDAADLGGAYPDLKRWVISSYQIVSTGFNMFQPSSLFHFYLSLRRLHCSDYAVTFWNFHSFPAVEISSRNLSCSAHHDPKAASWHDVL